MVVPPSKQEGSWRDIPKTWGSHQASQLFQQLYRFSLKNPVLITFSISKKKFFSFKFKQIITRARNTVSQKCRIVTIYKIHQLRFNQLLEYFNLLSVWSKYFRKLVFLHHNIILCISHQVTAISLFQNYRLRV